MKKYSSKSPSFVNLSDPASKAIVPGHNPIVQQAPESFIDQRELSKHKKSTQQKVMQVFSGSSSKHFS
jgi:hypothetical protein